MTIALRRGIWIPVSAKFLLVEYEILGFWIRTTALGIWNPSSTDKDLESNTWNPESKIVLDFFTGGDNQRNVLIYRVGVCCDSTSATIDIYCIPGRRIAEAEIYLLAAKVMDTNILYQKISTQ